MQETKRGKQDVAESIEREQWENRSEYLQKGEDRKNNEGCVEKNSRNIEDNEGLDDCVQNKEFEQQREIVPTFLSKKNQKPQKRTRNSKQEVNGKKDGERNSLEKRGNVRKTKGKQ